MLKGERVLRARTAINRELRLHNDNLGFDSPKEARHAILAHADDWRERWPDHTPELDSLAAAYIAAWRAHRANPR